MTIHHETSNFFALGGTGQTYDWAASKAVMSLIGSTGDTVNSAGNVDTFNLYGDTSLSVNLAPLHYGELLNVGSVHGVMSVTDFKPVDTIVLHGSPYATAQAAEAALKWDGPSTYSLNMGNGGSINFIGGSPPVNSIHVAP